MRLLSGWFQEKFTELMSHPDSSEECLATLCNLYGGHG